MNATLEADRAAILRVIADETAAYFNKDYEGWARCWVHAPYARRLGWYPRGGVLQHVGWEQEASYMKLNMAKYPAPNPAGAAIIRENIIMRIDRHIAWVTFDQIAPKTGDPFDVPGRQHEVRILERHDGEWKIACCFVLGSAPEFANYPLLRVDERSTVLWMNDAATEQLKGYDDLKVIGGRLRARNRASNERLQASIKWAAGIEGYAGRQAALSALPAKHGALPVLVGDGDAGRHLCWVIADSGMILVSFNDEQTTRQRLDAAAIIYGITPAQMKLARLIVDGHDVVDAARHLEISINTARTHIKRMFEKTGVNSQATLVRVLLSVAAPLA